MMLTCLDLMGWGVGNPHIDDLKERQTDSSVLGEGADGWQMKINSRKGEILCVSKTSTQLSGAAFWTLL